MTLHVEHTGEPRIEHPNRHKSASKTMRVVIIVLLLISTALIGLVTFGGWKVLQGVVVINIAWMLIYLLFAFYIARWNRGVLPVAAAMAMIMLIFAIIAVPSWLDRDAVGYTQPAIDASVLATITAIIIPVQALLLIAAMQGFRQEWNVEVEHWDDEEQGVLPAAA